MSDSSLQPNDIYDPVTRRNVIRLREEVPEQSLESCHYWYIYAKKDCAAAKARLQASPSHLNELSTVVELGTAQCTMSHPTRYSDLGAFPTEIWRMIASHLSYHDLCSLRLINGALADIAAELLVPKIHFDLSFESLERLRLIARHEHLRKGVRGLVFEAGLLAPIGCVHRYEAHYDLHHHADDRPQPPLKSEATPQAQRLYARNLAKFKKSLEDKYAKYRESFEAQQSLLSGPKEHLFECIDRFQNLEQVDLTPDRCRYLVSHRFAQRYTQDCAISLQIDPSQTTWQLQNIVRPGIKRLFAYQMSVDFFNGENGRTKAWMKSIFENLTHLSLSIQVEDFIVFFPVHSVICKGYLADAIGTATHLQDLSIQFSTSNAAADHLNQIIPENVSFPQLRHLRVGSFLTTEEEMMKILKSQVNLTELDLADVVLTEGSWLNLLIRMRRELHLVDFRPDGLLIDDDVELDTDYCDIYAWQRDREMFTLGSAIGIFVTFCDDDGWEEEEIFMNPAHRVVYGEFASPDDLEYEFGPLSDGYMEYDDSGNSSSEDEGTITDSETMNLAGYDQRSEPSDDTGPGDVEELPISPMEVD